MIADTVLLIAPETSKTDARPPWCFVRIDSWSSSKSQTTGATSQRSLDGIDLWNLTIPEWTGAIYPSLSLAICLSFVVSPRFLYFVGL